MRLFAELPGMGIVPSDEKHRTRGDRFDVFERIEIHELDVACERRVGCQLWRRACRSVFTTRRTVEVVKLPLDGVRVLIQLVHCPAGVFGFSTGELYVAL